MSLLLDALKQAEKQKNAEKSNDVASQESAADSIGLSIESMTQETDVDENKQDFVDGNEIEFEKAVNVKEVIEETPKAPEQLSGSSNTSFDSPSLTEKVNTNKEATAVETPLDSRLNVFAIGNTQPKTLYKKPVIILIVAVAILLFIVGAWYLLEYQTINEVSDEILEEDPLFENINETKQPVNNVETKVLKAPSQAVSDNKLSNQATEIHKNNASENESPNISEETAIKIKKRVISTDVYSQLDSAYRALKSANLGLARSQYSNVLKARPKQIDALLGLANIEIQEGNVHKARSLYEKVLVQEQANTIAQLGLLQTYSDKSPLAKQQVLEELSSKYPENINILTALGQSYATQSKWLKAQQTYFRAFSIQPANPSLAYNLAVSLDQLGKEAAAVSYYKKTIKLNERQSGSLDLTLITQRLKELGDVK